MVASKVVGSWTKLWSNLSIKYPQRLYSTHGVNSKSIIRDLLIIQRHLATAAATPASKLYAYRDRR